jgi:hypothetical protein
MPNIQPAAILAAGWVAKTITTDYGSGGNRRIRLVQNNGRSGTICRIAVYLIVSIGLDHTAAGSYEARTVGRHDRTADPCDSIRAY